MNGIELMGCEGGYFKWRVKRKKHILDNHWSPQ